MNPERLSARGPNAREDRKREEGMHTRVKNLEKITKELLVQIQLWEGENGPFYYGSSSGSSDSSSGGELYSQRVARQEENYVEIRDSLRNSRKTKNNKGMGSSSNSSSSSDSIKNNNGSSSSSTAAQSKENLLGKSKTMSSSTGSSSTIATATTTTTLINATHYIGLENLSVCQRNSTGSDGTEFTSATLVKERRVSSTE